MFLPFIGGVNLIKLYIGFAIKQFFCGHEFKKMNFYQKFKYNCTYFVFLTQIGTYCKSNLWSYKRTSVESKKKEKLQNVGNCRWRQILKFS